MKSSEEKFQRHRPRFRESDSFDDRSRYHGRFATLNRFGEENIRHDSYQDEPFDLTFEDEAGMKHPVEHGGSNRWSDDQRSEASHEGHAGKVPKGYVRSDARIREEVCDILSEDVRLDASQLEVEVHEGRVYLKGEVSSRRDKRLAEDLVEYVSGVIDVFNQIRVRMNQ